MTMATFARPRASFSSRLARGRPTPVTAMTIRSARSRSFSLPARTSTIRLPYALPQRIIAVVVSVLRTSLVAVPAFMRVEPARTSGPGTGLMTTSARSNFRASGAQVTKIVAAPTCLARSIAPRTNGASPQAEIPTTTSRGLSLLRSSARAPASASSSAPSTARRSDRAPPAMIPWTMDGRVPYVGGHSEASSTPSRPLVPAPT